MLKADHSNGSATNRTECLESKNLRNRDNLRDHCTMRTVYAYAIEPWSAHGALLVHRTACSTGAIEQERLVKWASLKPQQCHMPNTFTQKC